MSDLVTQPTWMPTRKVLAGLIVSFLTILAYIPLTRYAPGVPVIEFIEQYQIAITPLAGFIASWLVRERAVPPQ